MNEWLHLHRLHQFVKSSRTESWLCRHSSKVLAYCLDTNFYTLYMASVCPYRTFSDEMLMMVSLEMGEKKYCRI